MNASFWRKKGGVGQLVNDMTKTKEMEDGSEKI